jgi:hypothetical protein
MSKERMNVTKCREILSAVGSLVQGTVDGPEASTTGLTQTEKESQTGVVIRFKERGSNTPKNGPEGPICRSDIIAYDGNRLSTAEVETQPSTQTSGVTQGSQDTNLTWTQTEATAEYLSKGKTPKEGLQQAISSTAYHLLSRPDRVVVPGFYFDSKGFSLIFTGASGTCHTELKWTDLDHLQLLCDFVECIFDPTPSMVDPNITRNDKGTFDVKLKNEVHTGCKILFVGRPIGRRTTVFSTTDPDIPIIKEQYLSSPSIF